MSSTDLMTHQEVAALLGITPESVRSTLRRAGITEQRGYPRELVLSLHRQRHTPERSTKENALVEDSGSPLREAIAGIHGESWIDEAARSSLRAADSKFYRGDVE